MRVTLVTETYFPQVNGVSRTLGQLVRVLTESGDAVQLIHPHYGDAPTAANVHTVRSFVMPFYKELYLPRPPFTRIHRAIDNFEPDILHIATEATLGLSVHRHARRRGLAVVSSFHTNFDQYSGHYRVGWAQRRFGATCAGFITARTRPTSRRQRPRAISKRAAFAVSSCGSAESTARYSARDGPVAARASRARVVARRPCDFLREPDRAEKNVDYLAAALALVAAERPHVRVLLVGDGPSRRALEERIGSFARFAGYRQGEDLADHYAASDIFVFASLTETFGNVVLEAMASGLPVVALRAGGVGETVQPEATGILIDPAEPPASMASALIRLIDRPNERGRCPLRPEATPKAKAGTRSCGDCGSVMSR